VASGDDMSSLPTIEASSRLYELDGVERAEGYFRPLAGVSVSITVEAAQEENEPHAPFLNADKAAAQSLIGMPGVMVISSKAGRRLLIRL